MQRSASIATLFVIALVLVTSTLMGTYGALSYSTNKQRLLAGLHSEISNSADLAATSLSLAVWNLDRKQIDQIADGIMKDQDFHGVSIEAAGKVHTRTRDQDWNVVAAETLATGSDDITEIRTITFSNETIGTVRILGSTRFLDEELARIRNSNILAILLLELVLIASVYFLFSRVVLTPLKKIQSYAAATIAANKPGANLHELEFSGELEDLRSSLTAMTDLLDHRYEELQIAHDKIQNELEHRTKILKERVLLEERLAHGLKLESLGKLAGGIAHDFNNMLSVILGYSASLVARIPKDSPQQHDLSAIIRAAERAADTTRQLLAFSRKQVMDVKIVELNQIILDLKKILGRLLGDDIKVKITTLTKPAFVTADQSQLEQALVNLCINGRDAMPNGGTLAIETDLVTMDKHLSDTGQELGAGEYVVVNISDTGVGMDESTRKKIFEPFFTTKEHGKGTGLGLATVDGVVKQLGGEISVYSELGQGTTFKLYLPLVQKADAIPENAAETMAAKGNGEKILVLEDEVTLRAIICQMLTNLGYCPVEAASSDEAIKLATNQSGIALMLTDIIMPDQNGREVYEQIERVVPGLKVLYMSGYPQSVISSKGILEPGIEFIPKPFSENVLGKKILEMLSHQS